MAISDFPVEAVAKVVTLNLRVVSSNTGEEVTCDDLYCEECPIDHCTNTHKDCVAIVKYIHSYQVPPLLETNPELLL